MRTSLTLALLCASAYAQQEVGPVPKGMKMLCFTDNPDECVAVPLSEDERIPPVPSKPQYSDFMYDQCVEEGGDDCNQYRAPLMGGGGFGGDIDIEITPKPMPPMPKPDMENPEWEMIEKEEDPRLCANGEGFGCFNPDQDRPCSDNDQRLGCLSPEWELIDEMAKNKKGDGESSDDDDSAMKFFNDFINDGDVERFSVGIAAVATVAITQLF